MVQRAKLYFVSTPTSRGEGKSKTVFFQPNLLFLNEIPFIWVFLLEIGKDKTEFFRTDVRLFHPKTFSTP